MCLILLAWQVPPAFPLIVAANRDEFHTRRTAGADFWDDAPQVLAGRDLEAGGTWLGISRSGRFAALTNYRDPSRHDPAAPSRGRLVADFLSGTTDIDAYLDRVEDLRCNGFNLLLGTLGRESRRLVAFSNVTRARHELAPGLYGLSNAVLDTPWPKVGAGKTALAAALQMLPDDSALFGLLAQDQPYPDACLPDTGVGRDWERLLSSAFVRSPDYGTRCSTVLKVGADGRVSFTEKSWLPDGRPGGCRSHCLHLP